MKPMNPILSWNLKGFWNTFVFFVYIVAHYNIAEPEKAKIPILVLLTLTILLNVYWLCKKEDVPNEKVKLFKTMNKWIIAVWSIFHIIFIVREFPI